MTRVTKYDEPIGIAAARHRGMRELFEVYGLDYYCEGNLSIDEALEGAGLDSRAIRSRIERLSSADAGPNWPDEPLSVLIDHLESQDHEAVRTAMFRAALLFGDVCHARGDRRLLAMRMTFRDLSSEVIVHMEHEEHMLFPAINALEEAWRQGEEPSTKIEGGIRAAAGRFVREHAVIARHLTTLRRQRLEAEANAATTVELFAQLERVERHLHESMNFENYVAFPARSRSKTPSRNYQRRVLMNFLTRFDRIDPFDELMTLRNRMDRFVSRFADQPDQELFTTKWAPTADVVETKDSIIIKAELTGLTEKDINVELENGVLMLKGERRLEKETDEKGYRRIERSYGTFNRSFTLPPNVDTTKINAVYNNGLLEITIPKKEEAKPKAIHVDVKKKLTAAA